MVKDKVYKTIVGHTHFNPRIVETVSNYSNSQAMTDADFLRFIQEEFDNPAKVWEQPFRTDISPLARTILTVLWTFGGAAEIKQLKQAVVRMHSGLPAQEFAIQFSEGLRQLDGNFVWTNQFPGRARYESFHVVSFSNPSVEEFIANFLASEPSVLETLVRSIVTFQQASEIASNAAHEGKFGRLPDRFWLILRDLALAVENVPGGHRFNFKPHGEEIRQTWDPGEPDFPQQTFVLLQIAKKAKLVDETSHELNERVSTADGWSTLLRGLQNNHSRAHALKRVYEWIAQESSWSDGVKANCFAVYRRAFINFIADDDEIWACALHSLRVLVELILSDGIAWTSREREVLQTACKLATETIIDNDRTEYDVRSEATELQRIEELSGLKFQSEIAGLKRHADDLLEKSNESESSDPEARYSPDSKEEDAFDADALFAGLLER